MASDKLTPADPRVEHCYADLNGQTYHYLLGTPTSTPRATIFLIHGWPDLSFGWRHQIPHLLSLSLRVVVPDMMGYGLTAAPGPLSFYTLKRAADDLAALAAHLSAPQIILLGHDWGGAIVYRVAMWHPTLIAGIISICTPYSRPETDFTPLKDLVASRVPNFTYQVQLASGEVERKIFGRAKIRAFLNAMYGGQRADKRPGFVAEHGIYYENLEGMEKTRLLSDAELDFYAENYARHGLGPTLQWYRTRKLNFEDEKGVFAPEYVFKQPTLFVLATRDTALLPWMSKGMERSFERLERREVEAGHWALVQVPEECNGYIGEFLGKLLAEMSAKPKL